MANTLIRRAAHVFLADFYISGEIFVEGAVASWLNQQYSSEIAIYNCKAVPLDPQSKIPPFEQQRMMIQTRAIQALGFGSETQTGSLVTIINPMPFVMYLDHLLLKGLFQAHRTDGKGMTPFGNSPFASATRCFLSPIMPFKSRIPQSFPVLFVQRNYVRFYYPLAQS